MISDLTWTLASASPRRLNLLRQLGIEPVILVADIEEINGGLKPEVATIENAIKKADAVLSDVQSGILLAADTLVVYNEKAVGKPESINEAITLLSELSGQWHSVITGYSMVWIEKKLQYTGFEETRVHFRDLTGREVEKYVESGAPFDKAGGYGIQGKAGAFVDRIEGCYFNVVGLPLAKITGIVQNWLEDSYL